MLLSEDTAYVCTVIGSLNILTQAGSFGDVFMSGACFVSCHIQVLHTYTSVCWSSSGHSVHLVCVGPPVVTKSTLSAGVLVHLTNLYTGSQAAKTHLTIPTMGSAEGQEADTGKD